MIKVERTVGSVTYGAPFVGPMQHTAAINVDLSALTAAEIDAKGWLKPGIPLSKAGALVGVGVKVFGVVIEAAPVAADNATATIAALGVVPVVVGVLGAVNQDIAEDNLGRAYTAEEVAGFAGTPLALL